MLVITRKLGERVVVSLADGRPVWIRVVRIDGSQARLTFTCDRDIDIVREELYLDATRPVRFARPPLTARVQRPAVDPSLTPRDGGLCLARREQEAVWIEGSPDCAVRVVFIRTRGNRVQLGFVTAPGVGVVREEALARRNSEATPA